MSRWLLLAVIASSPAFAEEPPEDVRRLFAHGISLFGRGDVQGAREDFERVATTWRRPSVVYNLGLVYAVLGDSPRAVELLDEVLESPTRLSAVRVATTRDEGSAVRARAANRSEPRRALRLTTTAMSTPVTLRDGVRGAESMRVRSRSCRTRRGQRADSTRATQARGEKLIRCTPSSCSAAASTASTRCTSS